MFRSICLSVFFRRFVSNSEFYEVNRLFDPQGVNCSNSINHEPLQELSYIKYFLLVFFSCWDWTCNLRMISLNITFQTNVLSTAQCILAGQVRKKFRGLINLMSPSRFFVCLFFRFLFFFLAGWRGVIVFFLKFKKLHIDHNHEGFFVWWHINCRGLFNTFRRPEEIIIHPTWE